MFSTLLISSADLATIRFSEIAGLPLGSREPDPNHTQLTRYGWRHLYSSTRGDYRHELYSHPDMSNIHIAYYPSKSSKYKYRTLTTGKSSGEHLSDHADPHSAHSAALTYISRNDTSRKPNG